MFTKTTESLSKTVQNASEAYSSNEKTANAKSTAGHFFGLGLSFKTRFKDFFDRSAFYSKRSTERENIKKSFGEEASIRFYQKFSTTLQWFLGTKLDETAVAKFKESEKELQFKSDVIKLHLLPSDEKKQLHFILNEAGEELRNQFITKLPNDLKKDSLPLYKAIIEYRKNPTEDLLLSLKTSVEECPYLDNKEITLDNLSAMEDKLANEMMDNSISFKNHIGTLAPAPKISFGGEDTFFGKTGGAKIPAYGKWDINNSNFLDTKILTDTFDTDANRKGTSYSVQKDDHVTIIASDADEEKKIPKANKVLEIISQEICRSSGTASATLQANLKKISIHTAQKLVADSIKESATSNPDACLIQGEPREANIHYTKLNRTQIKISIQGTVESGKQENNSAILETRNYNKALTSEKHTATGTISMDLIANVNPATGEITHLEYTSAEGAWNIEVKAKK